MTKMCSKSLLAKALQTPLYAHQWYKVEYTSNRIDIGTTIDICNERKTIEAS
jgi:hypothetical protein